MNFLNNKTEFELLEFGKQNHEAYINAKPFPSGYYDNLFNPEMLSGNYCKNFLKLATPKMI
jgi:hypothetical protein